MRNKKFQFDVVVCGGGLAGFCAAIAAARHGAQTCLIHDRPVLGGNSSSEIRVAPQGSCTHHGYGRETGIISELLIEDRALNHERYIENGGMNSVWDMTLYNMALTTPNLQLFLNTSVVDVLLEDGTSGAQLNEDKAEPDLSLGFAHRKACNPSRKIQAVVAKVANAELELRIDGKTFIDCTGDGLVGHLAGGEWRMGTESKEEFGEYHAPDKASTDTMGNSIHFKAKLCDGPVAFTPPSWAVHYDNADFFYKQGRVPWDPRGGFWWIEIGVPWNTIHDAEDIRHELTRHAMGVWDWIKNRDTRLMEDAQCYSLDWIGQVPGKRESRRLMGQHLMTENDIGTRFFDEVAYGGWFIDLHTPGGLLAEHSEKRSAGDMDYAAKSYTAPYGIPLRSLIARDFDNLLMAGRNVSVTKATLGTVRVMCTTAIMGQAAGTAAAVANGRDLDVAKVPETCVEQVQQILLRDGCFLPNIPHADAEDLARKARVSVSSEALLRGVGPDSTTPLGGLGGWYARDEKDMYYPSEKEPIKTRRGQWIAVGEGILNSVSVFLGNDTNETQRVEVELHAVKDIWDYRVHPGEPLARGVLEVPPGPKQWITWPLNLSGLLPQSYVRLDLLANAKMDWPASPAVLPGCLSAYALNEEKMRRFNVGHTLCFSVDPPQASYGPGNVISGVTRPHKKTNLWRSDPNRKGPAWLQLEWDETQIIKSVELTFPGHMLRQFAAYPPQYRDPQCARDYSIEVADGFGWKEVIRISGNYQKRRVHYIDMPIKTRKLRVSVHSTNGDPSAALYEIRCY